MKKDLIDLSDLTQTDYHNIIRLAINTKTNYQNGVINEQLKHKTLAMIFDKSSTRTRVSFEAGMTQLGGHAIFLSNKDTQLRRNESIEDSARVIGAMVDLVMLRLSSHEDIKTFAKNSQASVINGLSDYSHPCQLLADLLTYNEYRGDIEGKTVAWVGDSNNMCTTYIQAAKLCDFKLNVATPPKYRPNINLVKKYQNYICLTNPEDACKDADLIVTDVWSSMGQEQNKNKKEQDFKMYKITSKLMNLAKTDALFMHCLPAYRDKEVDSAVIDGTQSVVFAAAENRLHAQKALLLYLLDN